MPRNWTYNKQKMAVMCTKRPRKKGIDIFVIRGKKFHFISVKCKKPRNEKKT
jgi:hypothetical protein